MNDPLESVRNMPVEYIESGGVKYRPGDVRVYEGKVWFVCCLYWDGVMLLRRTNWRGKIEDRVA